MSTKFIMPRGSDNQLEMFIRIVQGSLVISDEDLEKFFEGLKGNALSNALRSPFAAVRLKALKILCTRSGDNYYLLDATKCKYFDVKIGVINELLHRRGDESLSYLTYMMGNEGARIILILMYNLRHKKGKELTEQFASNIHHEDPAVRIVALQILEERRAKEKYNTN